MRTRYVYRDGKLVEEKKAKAKEFHNIQPDIKPYWSLASNRMIGSRSTRREDLKMTGCREVDPSEKRNFLKPKEHEPFRFNDKEMYEITKILDRDGIR